MNIETFMRAALNATPEARVAAYEKLTAKPSPMDKMPLLLNMGDAAKYLGVSRVTLWRMVNEGQIKKVQVTAKGYRISVADLDAFVNGGAR
jgi:excisionase family DNA binding protein